MSVAVCSNERDALALIPERPALVVDQIPPAAVLTLTRHGRDSSSTWRRCRCWRGHPDVGCAVVVLDRTPIAAAARPPGETHERG